MGFRDQQSTYDLKYAAEQGIKEAEKLGYNTNHAIIKFLHFAIIMSNFQMSPTETFDRWLAMLRSSSDFARDHIELGPNAVQAETAESEGD